MYYAGRHYGKSKFRISDTPAEYHSANQTGGLLLGTAALLALSLACNAMMLISSEAVWRMQMGGGLALFVPLCLLLLEGTIIAGQVDTAKCKY